MTWIKHNWRWAALNAVGLVAMANVLGHLDLINTYYEGSFDPLVECGKWAVRFLLFSLLMSPLNALFGWRAAVPLRKPAGLWAFGFGIVHFAFYVVAAWPYWLDPIPNWYAGLGVSALVVLSLMAATSTRWAMKRMGKWWKRLHRLVYGAGVAALVHGLLEAAWSKRVLVSGPQAGGEVTLYLAALALLLIVRIPPIRSGLITLRGLAARRLQPGSEV